MHSTEEVLVSGSAADLLSAIPSFAWWALGAAVAVCVLFVAFARIVRAIGNLVQLLAADDEKAARRRARLREATTTAWLYTLLYGFWAVAAGISMQGLIGFARDNMGLKGAWPYLIFCALDGAAAFCMVLVTKRAARAASTVVPRLAVWGLVAASSWFNHTHAPDNPGAKLAWAMIPVIAGVLFELAQSETRNKTARSDRRISAIQWLHPIERIRVLLELAADAEISADEATVRVRDAVAAAWMYRLRTAWTPFTGFARWRCRVSASRADFSDPTRAEEILRRVQILARVDDFAAMDFSSPVPARLALANLIGSDGGLTDGCRSGVAGGPRVIPGSLEPLPILASAKVLNGAFRLPAIDGEKVPAGTINGSAPNGFRFEGASASTQAALSTPEVQTEERPRTRRRAGRDTYSRINPQAAKYVADALLQGKEMSPQILLARYRTRSRTWADARIREGQQLADEIRASRGD
jgi:hypothetical protein